jgi:voltage-dependent calcium channel T type alpha-1G
MPEALQQSEIETRQDCLDLGGAWINKNANFDNVGSAILSLFIASTTEGWLEITFSGVDAVGVHVQP